MRLVAKTTLRGKDDNGAYAHWPKGSIFDDSIEPIPQTIIDELEAETGLVEDITVKNGGGEQKPAPSKTKTSSPINNKKQAGAKAKAKAPADSNKGGKAKTKKKSAKKKRSI